MDIISSIDVTFAMSLPQNKANMSIDKSSQKIKGRVKKLTSHSISLCNMSLGDITPSMLEDFSPGKYKEQRPSEHILSPYRQSLNDESLENEISGIDKLKTEEDKI